MKIAISKATLDDEQDLAAIINHSSQATIFHTREWNKMITKEFGIPSRRSGISASLQHHTLIARNSLAIPIGMYTFFVISAPPKRDFRFATTGSFNRIVSPFRDTDSIYGGPIVVDGETEEVIRLLITGAEKYISQRVEYYQILPPPRYPIKVFKQVHYRCRNLLTSIIDLRGTEEDLWHKIDSKRRNLIRKAIANKIKVICPVSDFIEAYYPMLLEVFDRAGKKPFPKSYYQCVLETPLGWVKPLLALHNNIPIAGAIFLCFKDTVYYWSGASLKDYRHLAPNDLIQWEIIKWANQNNYKYYDLLIVEPERLPQIAHFKLGFGGELVPIYEAKRYTTLGQAMRGINFIKSKIQNPKEVRPQSK
ncbi:MAG: peptidoglycan bridge formation glycyltransferase FemA/FemB family protein [Candidatus Stahlbacteria bacterium]|nr:peptidoglycan bridge formation glycyltransferase FemA/FemB family protein [Candidatus Stahlbacteria bacterium]